MYWTAWPSMLHAEVPGALAACPWRELNDGDLSLSLLSSRRLRCLAWLTSVLSQANTTLQIYHFIQNPLLIGLFATVNPTLVPLAFYTRDKLQYQFLLCFFFIILLLQWLNVSQKEPFPKWLSWYCSYIQVYSWNKILWKRGTKISPSLSNCL